MVGKNVNQVKIKKDDQVVTKRMNSKSDKEKAAVNEDPTFLFQRLVRTAGQSHESLEAFFLL